MQAIVTGEMVLVASLLWFDLWPLQWLEQTKPIYDGYNVWAGLWPM
jgi:hypothetical protein